MPRGRPRKTDPKQALEAAMQLFWEKGYEGTTMSDLVAATGMAKPGLYATFGDKQALYGKALDHYANEVGAPLVEDLTGSPDPLPVVIRRFLKRVAESAANRQCPSGCFVVNSVVEGADHPLALKDLARDLDGQRRAAFVRRFRKAKARGELPADADAKALAEFFAGQSMALAVMGRAGAGRKTLERFVDTAMTLLPAEAGRR